MLILLGVVAVAVIASVLIQRRNQAKLSENDAIFQQQDNQLAELATENQRLSNLVVQTKSKSATAEDRTREREPACFASRSRRSSAVVRILK